MREIKFRAWDEQNKVIHNDVEFLRSGVEGNDWIIFKSDKQKLEDKKVLDNPYFAQQIKLMQYTGLKDKNGKEIYENDIVKIDSWEPKIHEVVFDRGAFCFRSSKDDKFYNDCKYLERGEVIGNVFENPELLTNIN